MPAVTLAEQPPDPGWRPLSLPGWRCDHLLWPRRADGEAGPPEATVAALAAALGAVADTLFLAEASQAPHRLAAPWSLRRQGAPAAIGLVQTRDPAVIATLFDQPGFDWTQRGQMVWLFPPDAPPCADADILAAMAEDPPGTLPAACTGLLRPGTDGDFAELATRDAALRAALLAALSQPRAPTPRQ
ncbi:hypothetical protein [Roseococcus microcysteis]|uniref:hypothetical protein n=1 Tax=Roseococcus microcysteis TaxID=2771361 RepID=UPI00168BD807|nr:hypothetical protein [Roseococcus microcysteis]